MPSSGRPLSHTSCGALGAPCSVVDSGPPDRMMPFAPNAAISAGSWSHAQISQYTPSSRMRRAISCVYCAPKSRIRILSLWMLAFGSWVIAVPFSRNEEGKLASPFGGFASPRPVVRRFLGDLHVVHVALALARTRDLHEARLRAHVL